MLWLLKLLPFLGRIVPFLGLLKDNWKLVSAGLTVLSILATMWYINHLNDKIDEYSAAVTTCVEANASNQSTIKALKAANVKLAESVMVSADLRFAAAAEAKEREARAAAQLGDTIDELRKLRNEDPTCEEISKIDLGAVCPLAVERLREHAAGSRD
jgi:hypothetical protein